MLSGSRTRALTLFKRPILNRAYALNWPAEWRSPGYPRRRNFLLDTTRATRVQRCFLAFAELSQTTDCASQESKTNEQEGDPEAPGIAEAIADAQLYIEISQKRQNEQKTGCEHYPRPVLRPSVPLHLPLLAAPQS